VFWTPFGTITTVACDQYVSEGLHYFELNILDPGDTLVFGIAHFTIVDNFNLPPPPEHQHVGYSSTGKLIANGETVRDDLPRLEKNDIVGMTLDLDRRVVFIFKNRSPVGLLSVKNLRGRFIPCIVAVGQFDARLQHNADIPQPAPEWDPGTCQPEITVSEDCTTASVEEGDSTRVCWANGVYNDGTRYFEAFVDLHGRHGYIVLGLSNRSFFSNDITRPFQDLFAFGISSRGHILSGGKISSTDGVYFGSADRIGLSINFDDQTMVVFKNGRCALVGSCPGVSYSGVSQCVAFIKGPHIVRINPLPHAPLPPPTWDPTRRHPGIQVSNFNLTAKNTSKLGVPAIMTQRAFESGLNYFQLHIDYLPERGFATIGVAGGDVHEQDARVVAASLEHVALSSLGDIYVDGRRAHEGLEQYSTGDDVGIVVDVDSSAITWFRNGYPIAFHGRIPTHARPVVTMGYTNYQFTIDPVATIPETGTARWDPVAKHPAMKVSRDLLTVTNTSFMGSPTIRASSGFSRGTHYFEIRLDKMSLGGYMAFGVARESIHHNNAAYAPAKFEFFAYTSHGELYVKGTRTKSDIEKFGEGDDIGFKLDLDLGYIMFYRNRHPVAELIQVEGCVFPALTMGNEGFQATIYHNSRQRLATPKWDITMKPPMIIVYNHDMTCSNLTHHGYPTIRADAAFMTGMFYLEIIVDFLADGGYLVFGVGAMNVTQNNDYIPGERYTHFGYTSTGETVALGERAQGGLTPFNQGDTVGLVCNLDKQILLFFINDKQVALLRDLTQGIEYTPCVVFGNGPFQVSINPDPKIARRYKRLDAVFESV